jgi:hypothetical protein
MTYKALLSELHDLDDDQLDMPILALVDDEFYPVTELTVQEGSDRLEDGYPYIEVK